MYKKFTINQVFFPKAPNILLLLNCYLCYYF